MEDSVFGGAWDAIDLGFSGIQYNSASSQTRSSYSNGDPDYLEKMLSSAMETHKNTSQKPLLKDTVFMTLFADKNFAAIKSIYGESGLKVAVDMLANAPKPQAVTDTATPVVQTRRPNKPTQKVNTYARRTTISVKPKAPIWDRTVQKEQISKRDIPDSDEEDIGIPKVTALPKSNAVSSSNTFKVKMTATTKQHSIREKTTDQPGPNGKPARTANVTPAKPKPRNTTAEPIVEDEKKRKRLDSWRELEDLEPGQKRAKIEGDKKAAEQLAKKLVGIQKEQDSQKRKTIAFDSKATARGPIRSGGTAFSGVKRSSVLTKEHQQKKTITSGPSRAGQKVEQQQDPFFETLVKRSSFSGRTETTVQNTTITTDHKEGRRILIVARAKTTQQQQQSSERRDTNTVERVPTKGRDIPLEEQLPRFVSAIEGIRNSYPTPAYKPSAEYALAFKRREDKKKKALAWTTDKEQLAKDLEDDRKKKRKTTGDISIITCGTTGCNVQLSDGRTHCVLHGCDGKTNTGTRCNRGVRKYNDKYCNKHM